jgi:hypothetical protein
VIGNDIIDDFIDSLSEFSTSCLSISSTSMSIKALLLFLYFPTYYPKRNTFWSWIASVIIFMQAVAKQIFVVRFPKSFLEAFSANGCSCKPISWLFSKNLVMRSCVSPNWERHSSKIKTIFLCRKGSILPETFWTALFFFLIVVRPTWYYQSIVVLRIVYYPWHQHCLLNALNSVMVW